MYILELEAVSYSYLLDIEPRIRSFQHSEMECEDVIRQVLSAYPKSDLIDYVSSGTKLGGLTVQYRETDWQFLRRIASRFGAVVIPEVTADAPKLYFGVPDGGYHELKDQNYTVTRDLHALKMSWSVGAADVKEADFTSYRVETRRWFGLGDTVQFQGQELRVAAAESRLMQGMLIHTYTLSPHSGIRENEIRNDELAGASLEGRILAVTKDTVKVHLNVDATQAENEASWMPYSAVYASDGGGFYCMPQAGDSVQVYFGSGREQDAFAMGSVRRGSSPSPKTADPATKSWGTNFGKEMRMTDAEMSLIATEGSLFITLDDGGISITSNSGIQMKAVQDLVLDSEKSIEIEAKEILFLQCGDSSLVLDGMSDLRGSSLTMNGIIKMPVQVEDLEPQYEAPFVSEVAVPEEAAPEEQPKKKKKKGFWSKVLDVSQTVLDVAGLIPGVGEIADLANAGIYALRGDYMSASLSLAATVPGAGWAATGTKLFVNSKKFTKAANMVGKATKAVSKIADKGADVAKAIGKLADTTGDALNAGLGKVLTKAKKLASNVSTFDLAGKLKSGMNTILTNSSKLKKALHKNVSALDEMWTGWKQQVKHEVKKTAAQVMDQVSDTMTGLKNRLSGPQKALDGPSDFSFSKPDKSLPQNSQQQNFWSEMEAGKEELAKKMSGGTGKGDNVKLNKNGLTPEQEKYHRQRIDEAKARGDQKAADKARYERYLEKVKNKGEKPLDRKDWDTLNESLRKNRVRGREEEIKGRKALEEQLDRKLADNNADEVVTYTSSEGHVTRPDSIGRNDRGEIDLVHDHKHKAGGEDQIVHNDSQIRAEREMLQDKNGSHYVTISSDKPDLNAIPPKPRPSGPLGNKSYVYYTDPKIGKVTHKWEPNPLLPGGGRWKKL